ncbi:hypothetical protein MVEN_00086800 [Mycena venus]|uniref:Uncharacterized protein n=1 Tax=Mycena venus TaxID=2733690 RepID=A0A8H6Z8I7_9AGAR|nr:hypothetical protein MVEN_00086800 [Mycena venus]
MTLPHPPKRTSSDTTHVSDSEVSSESSTSTPSAPHPPFSVLSNITNEPPLRWTVERRLANIERGLVDMAKKLESQRPGIRKRGHSSVPPDSSPHDPHYQTRARHARPECGRQFTRWVARRAPHSP